MYIPILLTLLCYVASEPVVKIGPCKLGDGECLKKSLNHVIPIVFSGIPSLDIESVDPLFQEIIVADVPTLKLKLTNTIVKGFKDCTVDNINADINTLEATYTLECPGFSLNGMYEASGTIFSLPMEGTGEFEVVTSGFTVSCEAKFELVKGDDGKMYLQATGLETKYKALGPVKFDFKNLFNGQKDLADPLLKYLNENWKEVTDLTQDAVFKQNFDRIAKNFNKYLKTLPFDEMFTS